MTSQQTPLQLQQQANQWLELQRTGLNAKQQQAFLRWLNESSDHYDAYQQSQQVDQLLAQLGEGKTAAINKAVTLSPIRKVLAIAASVTILMVSLTSYYFGGNTDSNFTANYQSARDEQIDFNLPDGSKLSLDAQTQLALAFDAKQRVSHLSQGRALFDVAKNPQRPFIINTNRADITVLGTRFSVDSKVDSTRVSVEHGRVKVQSTRYGEPAVELVQGQQAVLSEHGVEVLNMNPQLVDAWRSGRLVFNNVPLNEVCAEFSRYHDANFKFSEYSVSNMMLSGTFNASELDNFLNLLPHVLPVNIKSNNNQVVISKS
ncbi:hypothetical protein GCM10009111_03030 [Colwellia asteriadis]|uniref:Uncharacterized protein n=1 Tax=Colwellia asteriadis TaxID=517723 RepID=A0ABN1L2R9_9GAMM